MTDPSLPDAALLQNLEKEALRDGITQQVVGAVVQQDNTILLLKRPPDDFMGGIHELPSGKTEPGETLNQALAHSAQCAPAQRPQRQALRLELGGSSSRTANATASSGGCRH